MMADKGSIYMEKSIGPINDPEEVLNVEEQKQNNDYIKRRTLYDKSYKLKAIGGQYQ